MPDNDSAAQAPKPRLLFVEDEATLREYLAEKLSDEYIVDTAGNGNEALLAVMRAKPALVVSDIVMPDMDGVELLKTLRASPGTRGIPVLLISGRAADEHRIEGFEQGADGFLAKPYTERELRALIGSMLRSARSRAEAAVRQGRDQVEQQTLLERAALQRAHAELRDLALELRDCLTPMRDSLDILQSRSSGDELSQRAVRSLDRQTLQLGRLVDDLLGATKR